MPPSQQRATVVKLLRRSHAGRHGSRKPKSERFTGVANMSPITESPLAAELRLEPGHWEGDISRGAKGHSAVETLVDRFTGMSLQIQFHSAHADEVLRAFLARLRKTRSESQGRPQAARGAPP